MSKLSYRFFVTSLILLGSVAVVLSQNNKPNNNNNSEDDFGNLQTEVKLTGEHLKAISVAFEAFKTDSLIPEEKRRIENYEIYVQQNKDKFFVLFLANRKKEEINLVGGESSLGIDVRYIISRQDYKIVRRFFMR